MLTLGNLAFFVTLVIVAAWLVEACVLSRRHSEDAKPFDWHEVWLSLADLAGRKFLTLVPLSLTAPIFNVAWSHRPAGR